MKRPLLSTWLVLCLAALAQPTRTTAGPAFETVALADIKAGAESFKGRFQLADLSEDDAPKTPLFRQYGTRTFATFKKHPELVASLKKLNPKFDPHTMATSNLNGIATIEGRTLLILNGCYPHNCGATEQVVAFEPATKRVYLLQPTNLGPDSESSGKFYVYGDPDSSVRAAMFYAFPNPD